MLKKWLSVLVLSAVIAADLTCLPVCANGEVNQQSAKEINITMDNLNEKGLPTDISLTAYPANKLHTVPDQKTSTFITNSKQIFYQGNIMINPLGKELAVRFGMDKANYNIFTGFDEVRFKVKAMKVTGYDDDATHQYAAPKLKVRLSDFNVSSGSVTAQSLINSKDGVYIQPSGFTTLADDQYEICTLKRSDFAGGDLNMDGELKAYTTEDGENHIMLLSFWSPARIGWLIDEISFVWYGGEEPEETDINLKDMVFRNNDNDISKLGLQAGTNVMTARLCNPTANAVGEEARLVLAMYNKKTSMLADIDLSPAAVAAGGETQVSLSIDLPAGSAAEDYEAKVIMLKDFDTIEPMMTSVYKFDTSGIVKN